MPIGSRLLVDAAEKVLKDLMILIAQSAKASAQAAIEAQPATTRLLEKLRDVVIENESLKT